MPFSTRKSGKFCRTKCVKQRMKISQAMQKKWVEYRHCKSDSSVNQNQSESFVNHDHQYHQQSKGNIVQEGLDVYEEEIDYGLPKGVIPIDKYKLVVELGHVVKQLKAGCMQCNLPLNICSSQGVQIRGLGGWIYIKCDNPACTKTNKVSLGKQHRKKMSEKKNPFELLPRGCAIFDVNTKAASGMLHAGIGEAHLNNLLSTLNLPQISPRILKVREEEIGSVIQMFANASVDSALVKEQELTNNEIHMSDRIPGIEISSDAAWQKQGSQCSYNSLSGIASAIGKRTKKIVHFNSRYKKCRVCWYASKHQRTPRKHQCRLNWQGSSKSIGT